MLLGFALFLTTCILIHKTVGMRRAAEHAVKTDVGFTLLYLAMLGGSTLGGLEAALFGGLFLSAFLLFYRWLYDIV